MEEKLKKIEGEIERLNARISKDKTKVKELTQETEMLKTKAMLEIFNKYEINSQNYEEIISKVRRELKTNDNKPKENVNGKESNKPNYGTTNK